jgi:hypothetical protein
LPTLQSIAEGVHKQIYPSQNDESAIKLPYFIDAAKGHYAYRIWELNRSENAMGEATVPPVLLSPYTLTVTDKKASIKDLKALRSLPHNMWLQSVGEFECDGCRYVVMDLDKWKKLCNDRSRTKKQKAVVVIGDYLQFPDGTFDDKGKVDIIYANMGEGLDKTTTIDEAIGDLVRRYLLETFAKRFPADKTNDSNPDK